MVLQLEWSAGSLVQVHCRLQEENSIPSTMHVANSLKVHLYCYPMIWMLLASKYGKTSALHGVQGLQQRRGGTSISSSQYL